MLEIQLNGAAKGVINQNRTDFLTTMLNNAEARMNHIDGLRQRNVNIAAIVFAAVFSFGFNFSGQAFRRLSLAGLVSNMVIFTLLDRHLHLLQHGWREAHRRFVTALRDVINDPDSDVTVLRYYKCGEKEAERLALQPVLYYLLTVAAVGSFVLTLMKVI